MLHWLRSFIIFVSRFVLSFYGIMIDHGIDRFFNLLKTLSSHYQVASSIFKPFHNLFDGKRPFVDRSQQTTCNYCGRKVKKVNISRHKISCASGTKFCPQYLNFFCKTQIEMHPHTATKLTIPSMITKTRCNNCEGEYSSFYSLQRHKKSAHGTTSRIQKANVNLHAIMGNYDNQALRQELTAY